MNLKYFSKFYKGENEPPKSLSKLGSLFWTYEKAFYHNNENPTKEDFDEWLDDLLRNYLPNKMMSAPLIDEEKVGEEWKKNYEIS